MSRNDEQNAGRLKRELTLRDLVLFNIVAVVSITSLATAARAGPSVLTLWLAAAALFFVPQGLAVVELSASYPEEGGIYAWARREFGERHGFLCGWCYWINNVVFFPSLLLSASSIALYAAGRGADGAGGNWTYTLAFTLGALWLAAALNVVGVGTGKWLQNVGGVGVYVALAILVAVGAHAALTRPAANPLPAGWWKPGFGDLSSLNLWATIPFAYAGLELCATLGGEARDARRNLPRSVYLAAPLIALVQLLAAGALVWLLPAPETSVVSGVFQAISAGSGSALGWLAPVAAACAVVARLGGLGAWLTGSARVAFAVGLDRYFPAAFGRVHPRWRTPHVAILVEAALATAFLLVGVVGRGTTVETAYLVLLDMSLLLYFIPYVYLFACHVRHRRRVAADGAAPYGKTLPAVVAAGCGLLVTVFAMAVTMIPPPETARPWLFAAKVAGGALLMIAAGGAVYLRAPKRR
jgi:amino acid transporter